MEKLLVIIGEIDMKLNPIFEKVNKFHNGKYIYTLPEYKSTIVMELLRHPEKPICLKTDLIKSVNMYLQTKIQLEYIPQMLCNITLLEKQTTFKQKSIEWLEARKNIISASEAGYLLGFSATSQIINYVKSKCGCKTSLESLKYLGSINHGVIFEDVTRLIYESRNNVIVKEFGLITTSKNIIIGASPDGIVISSSYCDNDNNKDNKDKHNMDKIGRLLEIKNPYSWDDKKDIKPEYAVQILQQQYAMDIPICDFVKSHIISCDYNKNAENAGYKQYTKLDDMLDDIFINDGSHIIGNENIPPENLCSLGNEKGILIKAKILNDNSNVKLDNEEIIIRIYPITIKYEKSSILEWIDNTIGKIKTEYNLTSEYVFKNISVKYWYVASYNQKTYIYNQSLYEENYLPRLNLIWNAILHIRKIGELHGIDKMTNFIDNVIKPHLTNTGAYYRDTSIERFHEICKLWSAITTMNIDIIDNNSNNYINDNNKKINKLKINKPKKKKEIIELDF